MSEIPESTLVFEPDAEAASRLEMRRGWFVREVAQGSFTPADFEKAASDTDQVFRPLPSQLIRRYAHAAASHAVFDRLEGGRWYGEVRALQGVWADGDSIDEVRETLEEVVEDWAMFRIERGDRDIPLVDTIDLRAL